MDAPERPLKSTRVRHEILLRLACLTRVGLSGVMLLVLAACSASRSEAPSVEEYLILPANHVPENQQPGPYNSDPPTSGPHFDTSFSAGFYGRGDVDTLPAFPEGYLVHNLEHGYVIFWYNCQRLTPSECGDLEASLKSTLDRSDNFKVIAFPWDSMDVNVAATTWGRMLKFETFDIKIALAFISDYRNMAPEPNAP